MSRLRAGWTSLLATLWFVPTFLVLASLLLGVVLVDLDAVTQTDLADRWPRIFGAGAEGARGMLTALATSMITVAGVVFSITIVALSLASSQYSPRLLRNFMNDRPTQVVLGGLVGIFAYCLVVLRTIRSADQGHFVPALAVAGGMLLGLVGVGLLIWFIHHVASSIQVSSILQRISGETLAAVDRLFPDPIGDDPPDPAPLEAREQPHVRNTVPAPRAGYVTAVRGSDLLQFACKHDVVVRLAPRVGDFVLEGQAVAWVSGAQHEASFGERIATMIDIGAQRTVEQDAPFGVQQIVDVALKALSPGIYDPTTAVMCIDQLTSILARLSTRVTESPYRYADGKLRVIAGGPRFDDFLRVAFDAVLSAGRHMPEVVDRVVGALDTLEPLNAEPSRRLALLRATDVALSCLAAAGYAPAGEVVAERARQLRLRLLDPPRTR